MLKPPLKLNIAELPLGEEALVVLRYPLFAPLPPTTMPQAEQAIAQWLVQGLSNSEIAQQRGTTIRTVANQVAAVYRRFGVHSRVELVHRLETLAAHQAEEGRETR